MNPKILPCEYEQRLQALQHQIRTCGLDAFVVSSFDSIYYLTGAGFEPLERPFFLVVRPTGTPMLLVPKLDQRHMAKAHGVPTDNIQTYREYPAPTVQGWPDRLRAMLPGQGMIGIEPTLRREITDQLQDFSCQTHALIEQLRQIKSPHEIDMIRRAARFADSGVRHLLDASYYGATVAEGFARTRDVSTQIIRNVEDWDPLTTSVLMATWAAPYSAMPHSVPSLDHRLHDGPHVALVLTRVNGYSAESERTYFTAPPSRDVEAAFQAMMEARRMAFALIRPGVPCGELDSMVSEFLGKEGFRGEDLRLHRIGHGIGLGTHEAPWLADGSDDRLRENMVISIEPGIYLNGVGGLRHSDTVLVKNDGYECLTHFETNLQALTLQNWRPKARLKGKVIQWKLGLSSRRPTRPGQALSV